MSKQWFEVDKKGLKELQSGKPKYYLMRELIQNALDEDITTCVVKMEYDRGKVTISVEDDSPIGFRDLTDSYTLFRTTHKRKDAETRGRFNMGEKQVFAICDTAEIMTTVGGVVFDKDGRHAKRKKREKGSVITVTLRMTREELEECFDYCSEIFVPEGIELQVDMKDKNNSSYGGVKFIEHTSPYKIFEARLQTELLDESGELPKVRKQTRDAKVHVHKSEDVSFIYEMGLPICEIDCEFSIDVQQKVPLGLDRDKVDGKYLTDLYGYVLNNTVDDIDREESSSLWVREATGSKVIEPLVVNSVINKRWGDKVAIANPFDPNANDEAISKGYKVIDSWEIGGAERDKIKEVGGIESTTSLFGIGAAPATHVEPGEIQKRVGNWAKRVAIELLGISLSVEYISNKGFAHIATYGGGRSSGVLTFNVGKMSRDYWELEGGAVNERMLDLIIHELGHSCGNHTEHAYHECITKLGAKLALKALSDDSWFKV